MGGGISSLTHSFTTNQTIKVAIGMFTQHPQLAWARGRAAHLGHIQNRVEVIGRGEGQSETLLGEGKEMGGRVRERQGLVTTTC